MSDKLREDKNTDISFTENAYGIALWYKGTKGHTDIEVHTMVSSML